MADNQGKSVRKQFHPIPNADPIGELLHSASLFGADFERFIGPLSVQSAAENAAGLELLAARTLKLVKKLTKGNRSPEAKEAIGFLVDLHIGFGEASTNAKKLLASYKEATRG